MLRMLKANICRAAVCDKCQKMALQSGTPARPRLVSLISSHNRIDLDFQNVIKAKKCRRVLALKSCCKEFQNFESHEFF